MKNLIEKVLSIFRNGYDHPNVGRMFYSPFFEDYIKVTYYKSDKNWRFKFRWNDHNRVALFIPGIDDFKAETRLSYFVKNGLEVPWSKYDHARKMKEMQE